VNLKDAFAGIREAKASAEPKPVPAPRLVKPAATAKAAAPLPLLKTGKSSHPEFEPVKIYLRKQTRKAAWRRWEDENGGDFSDLVQKLLEQYLGS
jgi:hypothetical protein